jgi:DNA-binding response OmpR family regulator
MSAHKILVADVDLATHREVEKALAGKGYDVAYATDGEQALATALKVRPDVLIIDPNLPNMDGTTVVRTLRTKPEHAMIPAIFLAERAIVEPRIQGFMIGADEFLPKPLNPAHLDERLEAAKRTSETTESTIRTTPETSEFSVVMTGFRGSLEMIGLPSLMTLMEFERKSGQLVIILEDVGDKARLYFYEGRVVRAKLDGRDTPRNAELIYQLFGRTKGKFDFRPSGVDGKDDIKLPTAMLLLEGARLLDEANRRARGT